METNRDEKRTNWIGSTIGFAVFLAIMSVWNSRADIGTTLLGNQTQVWQEFRPQEGNYVVLLPNTPNREESTLRAEGMNVPIVTYTAQTDKAYYAMAIYQMPALIATTNPDAKQEVLDSMADYMLKGSGTMFVSQTNISLDNHPGREVTSIRYSNDSDPSLVMTARIFLINNTPIALIVVRTKENQYHADEDRFLQSLRLEGD